MLMVKSLLLRRSHLLFRDAMSASVHVAEAEAEAVQMTAATATQVGRPKLQMPVPTCQHISSNLGQHASVKSITVEQYSVIFSRIY